MAKTALFTWNQRDMLAPTPRADFIRCWIISLLAPDIKQTKGKLKDKKGHMCCLGVASDLGEIPCKLDIEEERYYYESKEFWYSYTSQREKCARITKEDSHFPAHLHEFLRMKTHDGHFTVESSKVVLGSSLVRLNDEGQNFHHIAKRIRDNAKVIFKQLTNAEEIYILNTPISTRDAWREQRRVFRAKALEAKAQESQGSEA